MKNYKELKSGSDVRGYASDIFGNTVNLTDEAVFDITSAFVLFLEKKCNKKARVNHFGWTRLENHSRKNQDKGNRGVGQGRSDGY